MVKTPDEIKKGLELHYTAGRCKECPYTADAEFKKTCFQLVAMDALAYIQQLESLLGLQEAATRTAEQWVAELESRLAQAERERDAAVEDLRRSSFCGDCLHYAVYAENEPCASCLQRGSEKPNWQWRGVCPENTEEASDETAPDS